MPIVDNGDATVFAPHLDRARDPFRPAWQPPGGERLVVSLLVHAPSYQDDVPAGAHKPLSMQGGVGRETSEPRHGQVARLSQWDFGLTVGTWRLLDIVERAGLPVAVALDAQGAESMPGLARGVAERAGEIVVRGEAANIVVHPDMDAAAERAYISRARAVVEAATGATASGWFSPERAQTPRTTELLAAEGFAWAGDWPVDERPLALSGAAAGLASVPFSLETEDMFGLYTRGLRFTEYEWLVLATIDRLLDEARDGARFLGLSWFGWVSGQACFADVAERIVERLAADPDIAVALPRDVAARAHAE